MGFAGGRTAGAVASSAMVADVGVVTRGLGRSLAEILSGEGRRLFTGSELIEVLGRGRTVYRRGYSRTAPWLA